MGAYPSSDVLNFKTDCLNTKADSLNTNTNIDNANTNIDNTNTNPPDESKNATTSVAVSAPPVPMRDRFIQRLQTLGHNGEEISDLLVPDHTVIAGSFALQVLTDTYFTEKGSDIDIFTYNDTKIGEYLISRGYTVVQDDGSKKYVNKSDENEKILPYKYRINQIQKVTTYTSEKSAIPIQIILMKQSDPEKSMNRLIAENFDLDFCKVVFDGNDVMRYDNGSIDTKQCTFSVKKCGLNQTQLDTTWKRIKKYTNRGYSIVVTK
jgi:hypothetical protein